MTLDFASLDPGYGAHCCVRRAVDACAVEL
jgi:hypothetical protein